MGSLGPHACACMASLLLEPPPSSCEWRPIARVAEAGTRKLSMGVPDQRDRSSRALLGSLDDAAWHAGSSAIDRSRAIPDKLSALLHPAPLPVK
jgi:hypothetical protein